MEQTLIIKSGKCAWGKCIFCGWGKKEYPKKTFEELKEFTEKHVKDGIKRLKIYVSGSVLDENQIPFEYIKWLYKFASERNIKELVLETLPQFLSEEKAKELENLSKQYNITTYLAIGLEAADDELLKKLNKPFRLKDFEEFVNRAKKHNLKLRVYLLVNIPANYDYLEKSVDYLKDKADEIVLINLYPHKDSAMIYLWLQCFRNRLYDYIKDNRELLSKFASYYEANMGY